MRLGLRRLVAIAVAAGFCGAVLLWVGWINVAASTGHWAVTEWLLHTAMQRSVAFRADTKPPYDLSDATLIRRGAGHYEMGCAFCHGSPLQPRGAVPREMVPAPPDLAEKVPEWSPSELYWIVKHGVKFTGMPAWPSLKRDDEVWSVVAFLRQLPQMDAGGYVALAFGDIEPGAPPQGADATLAECARCHGLDGRGEANGAFPRLDILSRATIRTALAAYSEGVRDSGIMQTATRDLDAETLDRLADHYAEVRGADAPALSPTDVDPELLARGEAIAARGLPEKDVAACSGCHQADEAGGDMFPDLDGQYLPYLEGQLALYAQGVARGGGPYAELMFAAAHTLPQEDIEAVAAWYASRSP